VWAVGVPPRLEPFEFIFDYLNINLIDFLLFEVKNLKNLKN
jgi:hypothetical protein